jgi:hypothetical protein
MINIQKPEHRIKTIKPGDFGWSIINGLTITPRAGFEISQRCPENYRSLIQECIQHGWLKPVAYVKESEYVWEELSK